MARVREQDEDAFETLVYRHEDKVFRLAVRIVGNVEEARDIAQDVFIGIWDNPRAWKAKAEFTTWLYRVTFNRSLNRRRALKLKSMLSLSSTTLESEPAAPPAGDPDQVVLKNEETQRFSGELNRLPHRQRAALHLRYREELSVAEVAKSLGVSHKSAESLIFRGKQALRKRLK